MRTTTAAALASLTALTLALAGCGDSGGSGGSGGDGGNAVAKGGAKSLTFWVMKGTNPDASKFYAVAKKEFKKQTGATLNIQEVEWADAHDRLVRSFAGGGGPDVSEIGTTWTPEFAAAGGLADITKQVTSSGMGKDELKALKDSATYDGKQYGVGWYAGVRGIVYRKDIFKKDGVKVPTNWAELEQAVKTLKAKEPKMAAMPIAGGSSYASAPFIWGAGGAFATKDGDKWKGALDSKESQAGLKFYTDLALKDGSSTTAASTWKETDLLDAFAKNKAAMVIQGNWTPKTAIEQNPDLKNKIGAFAIPGKNGGVAPAFLGGSNLSVMQTSKKKDLAWKFVQMMTTGDLAKKWADQTGYLPTTKTALTPYAESSDKLVAPFATAMLKGGRNVPSAPQWGTVEGNKTITAMLQSILTGTSVESATKKASAAIESTLNAKS
ncbi:sugar ABC transporter substrate-binding protein [Flexivirga endophytica]|uniref:Sugar ABC transporter substrate-binding protein n=1 Tax=Flexivirga endophytica TaxID=1849103 RepID=A0A916WX52_9MICO|nr:sugar ABC transporter substrate-binding protein [Flexivirga endophytica]GGB40837.1 sugar ABC transporter substrate-binding protein [Flexivirga endophytica]GHB48624.1 sugar ABC transporter substrate-binding protein [Flexivirga endophytica]